MDKAPGMSYFSAAWMSSSMNSSVSRGGRGFPLDMQRSAATEREHSVMWMISGDGGIGPDLYAGGHCGRLSSAANQPDTCLRTSECTRNSILSPEQRMISAFSSANAEWNLASLGTTVSLYDFARESEGGDRVHWLEVQSWIAMVLW